MLEQYIGSIKKFLYDQNPVKLYSEKVPEALTRPSMFFSTPEVTDSLFSKLSYETVYILRVKLFEKTSEEAIQKAEQLAHSVRAIKYSIPKLNVNGSDTGEKLFFSRVDSSLVEDGVAQVTLTFETQHNFI